MLVRTQEGNAANDADPHHLRYLGAPVLVNDISVQRDLGNGQFQTITLDGVFGMNFLAASAEPITDIFDPFVTQASPFHWITFDEPNATVGLSMGVAGDANLDGKVDIGDLGLLAGNWQQLSGKVWDDGDFNYDGKVDIADLGLLAGNWQNGVGSGLSFDEAMAQFAAFDGVVVPEPTGAALALGALAGLVMRRRRRA
jgi:MYXO-CTERM domain-containing protein